MSLLLVVAAGQASTGSAVGSVGLSCSSVSKKGALGAQLGSVGLTDAAAGFAGRLGTASAAVGLSAVAGIGAKGAGASALGALGLSGAETTLKGALSDVTGAVGLSALSAGGRPPPILQPARRFKKSVGFIPLKMPVAAEGVVVVDLSREPQPQEYFAEAIVSVSLECGFEASASAFRDASIAPAVAVDAEASLAAAHEATDALIAEMFAAAAIEGVQDSTSCALVGASADVKPDLWKDRLVSKEEALAILEGLD